MSKVPSYSCDQAQQALLDVYLAFYQSKHIGLILPLNYFKGRKEERCHFREIIPLCCSVTLYMFSICLLCHWCCSDILEWMITVQRSVQRINHWMLRPWLQSSVSSTQSSSYVCRLLSLKTLLRVFLSLSLLSLLLQLLCVPAGETGQCSV